MSTFLARRPVWQVNYLAALAACVVVELWGLIWRAAGVPMRAAGLGSPHASTITVGMFAMGTLVVTFWFTFVVVLIARFARHPRRVYLRTALPLLVLSLAAPILAADTATATKVVLAVAHLIAGAIIIPVVARRLGIPRQSGVRAIADGARPPSNQPPAAATSGSPMTSPARFSSGTSPSQRS